ncbi:hypothetical protein BJ741DRAFT_668021 [Chytriomyces cf. hyalinus JEL632]|nr:hypothetical protein BJ741DRAFT_668021 [Chytriomyces cf. hyalinus JEL632]
MILTTERFTLRVVEPSDASTLETLSPAHSFLLTSKSQPSNTLFTILLNDTNEAVGIAGIKGCIDENGNAATVFHLTHEHRHALSLQEIWNKLLQYFFEQVCVLGLVSSEDGLDLELLKMLGFDAASPFEYTLTRDAWMRRAASKYINTRTINTKNLLLRKYSATDTPFIHSCMSNPQVMTYWSTLPHTDLSQTNAWVATVLKEGPNNVNGILDFIMHHKSTNQAIGKIGIYQPLLKDGSGEVGYFLHPEFWGQGLMKEAMQAFLEYVFEGKEATVIKADVDPRNAASMRLLENVGFVETAREERTLLVGEEWVDSVYLELSRQTDIQSLHKVLQSQSESFEEAPAKKAKIHRTTLPPTISTATVYAGLVSESPDIVSLLLEYGADPSLLDNGALIHAALTNNTHVVSLLVRDARVNVCQDNGRAILLATLHKNTHLLQLLLHAIPPNSYCNPTIIPLAIAARNNDTHSATLLLSHPTMHNASPLHLSMTLVFAAEAGNVDVVRGLLQSAFVDPAFASGAAYIMAHKNRRRDVELVLLNTGRVVTQSSMDGNNGMPMDLAIADPKWWVPVQADAYKFYDAVVHARI